MVGHSAKHTLASALLALVAPGDEVVIPLPAWVSYIELVKLAGGVPVGVPPRADGRPDLEALAAACGSASARGVLFNSPCNPSGYVWTRAETERLCEASAERGLFLISDEIYRRLVYEGEPAVSPVSLGEEPRSRTVIIDGASKAYAMTGYRIGYAAGPTDVIDGVIRLQSQMTGAPNTVSQAAYEACLTSEPPEVARMVEEFAARRRYLVDALVELGLPTPEPRGAFYAFPNVARYLDGRGSAGFCDDLLGARDLVLVPGDAFGQDEHVRLSYALPMERLREAIERLGSFLR